MAWNSGIFSVKVLASHAQTVLEKKFKIKREIIGHNYESDASYWDKQSIEDDDKHKKPITKREEFLKNLNKAKTEHAK